MAKPPDLGQAHVRIARLSADLAAAVKFYRDGLGFEVLYEFKDHDGFDAVMLSAAREQRIIWRSFTRPATKWRRRRPTTTCSCSTFRTPKNGRVP
jgi:catechol 2,3-dioxygenase-like lactoylglutathione lyase family enzyme